MRYLLLLLLAGCTTNQSSIATSGIDSGKNFCYGICAWEPVRLNDHTTTVEPVELLIKIDHEEGVEPVEEIPYPAVECSKEYPELCDE